MLSLLSIYLRDMSAGELVEFLQRQAADHLRGVVRYHGDATDTLYLREDIRAERLQSQIDRMIRRLRPEADPDEERAFPFGDLYVTVRRFEEAIIMHFPTGSDRGIVVALKPDVARDLNMFTRECLKRIE